MIFTGLSLIMDHLSAPGILFGFSAKNSDSNAYWAKDFTFPVASLATAAKNIPQLHQIISTIKIRCSKTSKRRGRKQPEAKASASQPEKKKASCCSGTVGSEVRTPSSRDRTFWEEKKE